MKLHHIGKVVPDLAEELAYYKETFGIEPIAESVVDPIQKVEVVLLDLGYGETITLELISPISDDSPVAKFLKKGGGLHHLSYAVDNIDQAIEDLKQKGAIILGEKVPGKGHHDKSTVWLYTRAKELVELVELK